MRVGEGMVQTAPFFKIVGVILGQHLRAGTANHIEQRLVKALATTQRLRVLELPAAICSHLWRTTVLPQALHGCEVRDVRPLQLQNLSSAGKAAISSKLQLKLNVWRAPEVIMGPPLGDTSVR